MCHFITLIVPSADKDAVRAVMERHGRGATPIDNPSLRTLLKDQERQYLTNSRTCDCGTVLGRDQQTGDEKDADREAARLKRKGWSDAKIARALGDKLRAEERPNPRDPDSFELWHAVLDDLRTNLGLPYVGLFVRSYAGDLASETFNASRRQIRAGTDWMDALRQIEEDEAVFF